MGERRSLSAWPLAVVALAGTWMFPYEAWRELFPGQLAVVLCTAWLFAAVAWSARFEVSWRPPLVFLVSLLAIDVALDLASPFPRRFVMPSWELLRVTLLGVASFVAVLVRPHIPRILRVVRVASLLFALHIPVAIAWIAIHGARDQSQPADAALVLGFSLAPDGSPRPQLVARVGRAVELYKRGLVKTLVLSGGAAKNGRTEASVMRDLALAAGVPEGALVLETNSRSTIENFACSRPVLAQLGAASVLLVTEPWHMARATLLAHRHGLPVLAAPATSPIWESPRDAFFWLYRDANAFVRESLRQFYADPGVCQARDCDGCRRM